MFEEAKKIRDRRLRRRILWVLHTALGLGMRNGEVSGEMIHAQVNSLLGRDMRLEDEQHLHTLLGELRVKGLIEERDARQFPGRQKRDLAHLMYRITSAGIANQNQTGPVDGDIEDDRVEEE